MWLGANVSVHVKSQTIHFPFVHGKIVIPSGRLPSSLETPVGSKTEVILAELRPRLIRSFTCECLENLPALLLQLNPCVPLWSTSVPQMQVCGWHIGEPRRKAQEILSCVLSSLRPTEGMG